jgi:hypothetical protein
MSIHTSTSTSDQLLCTPGNQREIHNGNILVVVIILRIAEIPHDFFYRVSLPELTGCPAGLYSPIRNWGGSGSGSGRW